MDVSLIATGCLTLLFLFLATFIIILVYSGLLVQVEVGTGRPHIGQVVLAYKFARGPYKNVGPLFAQVSKIAPGNKCLGIYYDDPDKVEAKRLRHIVGCVLAEGTQEVDEELVKKFKAEGFQIFQLPQVEYVVQTSFPFVTTLSIIIAVQKVYPKMQDYVKEHSLCAHPFLEVYEGRVTHFMAPLSQQADFYVPEALQHFEGEEPYESYYSDESTQDLSHSEVSSALQEESQTEHSAVDSSSQQQQGDESIPQEAKSSPTALPRPDAEDHVSDEESTSSFEEVRLEAEGTRGSSAQ